MKFVELIRAAILNKRDEFLVRWLETVLQRNPRLPVKDELVEYFIGRDTEQAIRALTAADPVFAHRQLSFSQEGEDLILQRLLADRPPGFFVDVGAYHPIRFSNTYVLYRQGWRGINIDATPGAMRLFSEVRSEDINLEAFVAEE